MPHLIPKHQLGNIILPHKVVTYDRNDARSYWSSLNNNIQSGARDIPGYSNTLKHAVNLKYLSHPDELRAKAINTMLWANKNGVTPSDIPKLLPSELPMDTGQIYSMFDDNSIINYLNKFLMFTGAAGMANKKASPK